MYRKSITLLLIAMLIVAALPLVGQSTAAAEGEALSIGLSVSTLDDPMIAGLRDGAQTAASDLSVNLVVMSADGSVDTELANVQALIDQGVNVLVIAPVDPVGSQAAIAAANDAGIPVLLTGFDPNTAMQDVTVVSTVVPNEVQGGWLAASVLCEAVGSGTALELVGDAEDTVAQARSEGFNMFMSQQCADATVVQMATAGLDRDTLINNFIDELNTQTINGVFAYNDTTTLAALEASIIARKGGIAFVGFDASDDAMAALQQGRLQAIVTPVGWLLGTTGVQAANAYLNGTELPATIQVQLGVLNVESTAMFRGGPRSGSFEGDPRSGSFEGGPGSGNFEGGPGSGNFEGGPGSGNFEGGPGSGNFEGGPGSGNFEGGPASGNFE